MTPPLCACGCGRKTRRIYGTKYRKYLNHAHAGRAGARTRQMSDKIRDAARRWQEARREERYARFVAVLKAYQRQTIELPAVLQALYLLELRSYQRGFEVGRRGRKGEGVGRITFGPSEHYEPTLRDA